MRPEENRFRAQFYVLLACFWMAHLVLFGVLQTRTEVWRTADSGDYLTAAHNLYHYGDFYCGRIRAQINPAYYTKRTPAYPFVIGFLGLFGDPVRLTILWQIALNLAGAALLWRLGRLLGMQPRDRLLLAALLLCYPAQIVYTHTIMAEVMFETLVLVTVTLLAAYLSSRRETLLALANIALGLATLTKPVLVYFWVPNLAYHGWLAYRFRRARLAAWALIPVALISLWSFRNYERTGYFHFSSITRTTLRLRMMRVPGFQEKWAARPKAGRDLRSDTRALEQAYLENSLENWPRTLWRQAVGMGSFFVDPGRFDVYQILGLPQDVRLGRALAGTDQRFMSALARIPPPILALLALLLLANLFIFAGFVVWVASPRQPVELRVFAALLVLYVATITGSIGVSRYRLGVEPILLLGVPFFIRWIMARWRRRREPERTAQEFTE